MILGALAVAVFAFCEIVTDSQLPFTVYGFAAGALFGKGYGIAEERGKL